MLSSSRRTILRTIGIALVILGSLLASFALNLDSANRLVPTWAVVVEVTPADPRGHDDPGRGRRTSSRKP